MEQNANGSSKDYIEKKEIDSVKFWIERIKRNIGLFVFFGIFGIFIAFLYNNIAPEIYQVKLTIFLKNNSSKLLELQGIPNIAETQNFIHNETELLKSSRLIKRALKKLDFRVVYYSFQSFRKINLYHDAPFWVIPLDTIINSSSENIHLTIVNHFQFKLWSKQNKDARVYSFGDTILFQNFKFKILLSKPVYQENEYCFRFRGEREIFDTFREIKINKLASSTVISVSVNGENPKEIAAFLNTLCNEYLIRSVEKKELISNKTIDFIELQLKDFSDSLHHSGRKLSGFKSSHQIMDFDQHSEKTFTELAELQKEKVTILTQIKYFEYLVDYLNDNSNSNKDIITPAVMGVDNQILNKLIEALVSQSEEKSELILAANKENPLTKANDLKIEETKKHIIENVKGLIELSKSSLENVEQNIETLSNNASQLPKTQLELFNYERMFKIYDVLYTYLLTKRCEIQITKAALTPENEVLDIANPEDAILMAPRKLNNYLIALFLGLSIPVFLLILINYLSDKVRNLEEIEDFGFPVLGQILHYTVKDDVPVYSKPSSILAESFRSVRTNFQFISEKKSAQVIVVTSTMKDEGKSFVSLNLASCFALSGKKCIIVYFDLRKKIEFAPFELKNNIGLSNVLSGKIHASEAIKQSSIDNLYVMLPGTLPPNPAEMISSEHCDDLMVYLKEHFDYIFLDTPPIGLFTDALMLFKYSTANIFLIRYSHTNKKALSRVLSDLKQKNIKIHIIVNDLPFKQSNYGYGYGYNYKYDYNKELKEINIFTSFWKKSKSIWN